ncbi:MAG: class I SAM-dependent methyltransferase [Candidatus Paracaedibacter sp.]
MTYICPKHKIALATKDQSLLCDQGCVFPLKKIGLISIASFEKEEKEEIELNEQIYKGKKQNLIYRHFLSWLFETFNTTDHDFRKTIFNQLKIKDNFKILITGCGNGDEIIAVNKIFEGMKLSISGQDISAEMVTYTADRLNKEQILNCNLSISNACNLPYPSDYFDLAYHMGGINFMGDTKTAIQEMTRVVKNGGQVAFIDEGVAPWLRETEYGKMMVNNNSLWNCHAPIDKLPFNASEVKVTWLLENCFYFIRFIKNNNFPNVNLDVIHLGKRGGSIRTRFFGQLEGVSAKAKQIAIQQAGESGKSISQWLDDLITKTTSSKKL